MYIVEHDAAPGEKVGYSQREPHDIAVGGVAILAVIQNGYSKPMLWQISPFLGTHLEKQR